MSQNPRYDSANRANFPIPDKMKCSICQRWKTTEKYSNKELKNWQYSQYREVNDAIKGIRPTYSKIRCRSCTSGNKMEMRCTLCRVVYALEDFSKTQRTRPDNARCRNCVGWHESIDPRITPIVGYDGEEFPDPPEAGFVPSAHSDTGFTVGSDASDMESQKRFLDLTSPSNRVLGNTSLVPATDPLRSRAMGYSSNVSEASSFSLSTQSSESHSQYRHLDAYSVTANTASSSMGDPDEFGSQSEDSTSTASISGSRDHGNSSTSNPYESSGSIPGFHNNMSWGSPARPVFVAGNAYGDYDQRGQAPDRQGSYAASSTGTDVASSTRSSGYSVLPPADDYKLSRHGWPISLGPKRVQPEFQQSVFPGPVVPGNAVGYFDDSDPDDA